MRPIVTVRVAWSVCRYVTLLNPAKTAERIEMPFGSWTPVSPMKHVLGGVHTGATWRIPLNRPRAAMRTPTSYMFLCDHPNLNPKRHLDRFSRFAQLTAECPYTLQWAAPPPQNCPFPWQVRSPSSTWFLGPTRVLNQTASRSVQPCFQGSLL